VNFNGDERIAALVDLADDLVDLNFVEQEFSLPPRVARGKSAALVIDSDVHVLEVDFASADLAEALAERRSAFPQGLDFIPLKDDTGLVFFLDEVLKRGGFVVGDDF